MSVSKPVRRQRVRLDEPTSKSPRRQRVRLSSPTEADLIAEYIRVNGITKCPTAAVETVRGLYPRRTEIDKLRTLAIQAEKDPRKMQQLRDIRFRIQQKNEAWVKLLLQEGKPIPPALQALALRHS